MKTFSIGLGVRLLGAGLIWLGDGSDSLFRKCVVIVGVILMVSGMAVLRYMLLSKPLAQAEAAIRRRREVPLATQHGDTADRLITGPTLQLTMLGSALHFRTLSASRSRNGAAVVSGGIRSASRRTISSVVTPSASAAKLVMIRCRAPAGRRRTSSVPHRRGRATRPAPLPPARAPASPVGPPPR